MLNFLVIGTQGDGHLPSSFFRLKGEVSPFKRLFADGILRASFFYQYVAADAAGFVNVQNRSQPFDLSTGFYVPFMHLSSSHLPPRTFRRRINLIFKCYRGRLFLSFSTRGVAPCLCGLLTITPPMVARLSMVVKKFKLCNCQFSHFTFSNFHIYSVFQSFSRPFVPVVLFLSVFRSSLRQSSSHPFLTLEAHTHLLHLLRPSVGVLVWSKFARGSVSEGDGKAFPRCLNISSGVSISMPNFM